MKKVRLFYLHALFFLLPSGRRDWTCISATFWWGKSIRNISMMLVSPDNRNKKNFPNSNSRKIKTFVVLICTKLLCNISGWFVKLSQWDSRDASRIRECDKKIVSSERKIEKREWVKRKEAWKKDNDNDKTFSRRFPLSFMLLSFSHSSSFGSWFIFKRFSRFSLLKAWRSKDLWQWCDWLL